MRGPLIFLENSIKSEQNKMRLLAFFKILLLVALTKEEQCCEMPLVLIWR